MAGEELICIAKVKGRVKKWSAWKRKRRAAEAVCHLANAESRMKGKGEEKRGGGEREIERATEREW